MIVSWISLDFGLLVKQNKQIKDLENIFGACYIDLLQKRSKMIIKRALILTGQQFKSHDDVFLIFVHVFIYKMYLSSPINPRGRAVFMLPECNIVCTLWRPVTHTSPRLD